MAARTISKRELAAEVGRLWGDLAVQSKRSIRPLLEAEGVTMPQAIVLQTLRAAGGRQPARDLGRECHMLASTVTGVIDRLELAGHVRRERDSRRQHCRGRNHQPTRPRRGRGCSIAT